MSSLANFPYLGDGVDLVAVGDVGRSRAVGDVLVDDLGDDLGAVLGGPGLGADGGSDESGSVLHFCGWRDNSIFVDKRM